MRIAYLCPTLEGDSSYYRKMVQFARLAAKDLNVEFEILDAGDDTALMQRQARELIESGDRPDYVMAVNHKAVATELLPQLCEGGLKTLVVVEGFVIADKLALGDPRQKHATWLGGLLPDDEQAGQLLAEVLIAAAREQGLAGSDGRIHMIGLSGAFGAGAIQRVKGLRAAVDAGGVVLEEVAPAMWMRNAGALHAAKLMERHPEASVVWAANDDMALGALDAAREAGRRPGQDILVGGIDWSPSAVEEVENGEFVASVGGHFLDGAWAVVMLFDHHQGRDFGPVIQHSAFTPMTSANISRYRVFFDESRWSDIRFSEFSKAANPAVNDYDFSVDAVLSKL